MDSDNEAAPLIPHNPRVLASNPDNDVLLETAINDALQSFQDPELGEEEDEDVIWLREQRELNKSLHWAKRPSALQIGGILFFAGLISNFLQPSLESIYNKLACNSLIEEGRDGTCDPAEVQVFLSSFNSIVLILSLIVSIITATQYGRLSDIYGRKPFIIFAFVTISLSTLLSFYLISHYSTFKFGWLVFSNVIATIGGSIPTLLAICKAYISDVSEPHELVYSFGLIVSATSLGFSIAPLITSLIFRIHDYFPNPGSSSTLQQIDNFEFIPIKIGAILMLLLTLYTIILLPESRGTKAKAKSRSLLISNSPESQSLLSHLKFWHYLKIMVLPSDSVKSSIPQKSLTKARFLFLSINFINTINLSIHMGLATLLDQYGIFKFNWTTPDIAGVSFLTSIARIIVLAVISPFLYNFLFLKVFKLKTKDDKLDKVDFNMIFIALFFQIIGLFFLPFASSSSQMVFWYTLSLICYILDPTLSSTSLKYLSEQKAGEYFGGVSTFGNIGTLIIPPVVFVVYSFGVRCNFAGIVFWLCSLFSILALIVVSIGEFMIKDQEYGTVEINPLENHHSESEADNRKIAANVLVSAA
ncbi:MFS general substrate transporter [Hyphopichia burtonii NRRL Y-1933]|uniref:MFS general substrate transporter n=1 Tax=Hyphopichia burtonii NRRL Y-1933 TaxID=984485 RepID=A0A1E4RGW1_9ASCO|nr:MFS general substrate transporter [Hyphopichia burtonii NRRL Y-1933]ODV66451.1 MFS general substrate transporter [Hyphopichia burtonii NRRL Y-1933]